ncbi:MAG: hypothetical protein FD123_72 [Bacteroidetes bacterium]|nr:MAG: hypothetical protein FD123_72 [Bacteroidota bacterium]
MNTRERSQSLFRSLLVLGGGALLLAFMAFYNGYALTYPDTGAYIRAGMEGVVPNDRPIAYGLFIRHVSLHDTLWLVVLAQCLLTAWTIRLFIRSFVTKFNHDLLFFISIGLLTAFTCLSQKSSTLLPDFLTAPLGLLVTVWLFRPPGKMRDKIISLVIVVFALLSHTSHVFILILALVFVLLLRLRKKSGLREIPRKRFVFAAGLIVSAFLLLGTLNLGYSGRFFINQNQHIFLMGRMVDAGIVEEYLNANCDKKNYSLCAYKDSLPYSDFIWDYVRSPLYKVGGWEHTRPEFNRLMGDMLRDPRCLKRIVTKSAEYSARQFFDFRMDLGSENPEQGPGSPSYIEVYRHFHHELRSYSSALQQHDGLNYRRMENSQYVFVFLSWFLLILFFTMKNIRERITSLGPVVRFLFLFVAANAVICGCLSVVLPRYQTRVIWIFPLLLLIALAETGILSHLTDRLKKLIPGGNTN